MRLVGIRDQMLSSTAYAELLVAGRNLGASQLEQAAAAKERDALAAARAEALRAQLLLGVHIGTLRSIAIREYTQGVSAISSLFAPPSIVESEKATYIGTAVSALSAEIATERRVISSWPSVRRNDEGVVGQDLAQAQADLDKASEDRGMARKDVVSLGGTSLNDFPTVVTWEASGISRIALASYISGAALANRVVPGCGIHWYEVAAVGFIESRQGRYLGSTISSTGEVLPPIFGVPLDGRGDTAKIPMTQTAIADGGGPFARAVGPLQVLPSTWANVSAIIQAKTGAAPSDPNNFPQAAQVAATDLCIGGSFLGGPSLSAYLHYNDSVHYAQRAVALANAYEGMASSSLRTWVGGPSGAPGGSAS